MHDDLDDHEPEHDQYLDSGDELEDMFGDELDDESKPERQSQENAPEHEDDNDPVDEYQAGLDDDW